MSNPRKVIDDAAEVAKAVYDNLAKKVVDGITKGHGGYRYHQGNNYEIKFDTSKVCAVNIMDKTKGQWALRLDKPKVINTPEFVVPKGNVQFKPHININPKISGVPDPHIQLSPNTLFAGKHVAKFCKVMSKVNEVAVPVTVALDAVSVVISVYDDVKNKTSRNTVETAVGIAGGWGGGYGGAAGGAAIGTAICPVLGTIIGGLTGGLIGGLVGSLGASKAAEVIGNACGYDTDIVQCNKCRKETKILWREM